MIDGLEVLMPNRRNRIASDDTMDDFEDVRSLKLPTNYREMCKSFGAGELCGFYRFAVPLAVDDEYDLATFDESAHGRPEDEVWEEYVEPGDLKNFLFFASTIGGELFAWHVEKSEGRDRRNIDHEVYRFGHRPPAVRVAKGFSEFFLACRDGKLDSFDDGPCQTYLRY